MLIWIILVLFLPFLRSLVVAHELNKEEAPLLRWPQENPEFLQLGENIPEKTTHGLCKRCFLVCHQQPGWGHWEDWGGLFGGFGSVVQTPCPSLNPILGLSCGHGRFLDQCSVGSKGSAAPLPQAGLWRAGRATAWVLAASREFISSFLFFRSSSGTLQTCAGDGVW